MAIVVGLLMVADYQALVQTGELALKRRDLRGAEQSFAAAAKLKPKEGQAWILLAQVRWLRDQRMSAREAASEAERVAGDDPRVLASLAQFYLEAGQPVAAAERADRLARLKPDDESIVRAAAGLWLQVGEPRGCAALLRSIPRRTAGLVVQQAKCEAMSGDGETAAETLQAAVKAYPGSEDAQFAWGQFLLEQGKFAEAASALDAIAPKFPRSAQVRLGQGVAQYALRKFDVAADRFLEVSKLDPAVEQPYAFLSKMITQVPADRLPEIERRTAIWAAAHPKDARAPLWLAKLMSAQGGDDTKVEALLRKSLALADEEWESHFELGVLLAKKKAWAEAEKHLTRASALAPNEAATYYHLARVEDRLGKAEAAQEARARHEALTAAGGKGGMGSGAAIK